MSRVLVIPDVHLKPWMFRKAEELHKINAYDCFVVLGDLADDWGQESNTGLYRDTYDALINLEKKYHNVYFCYGNHDISYVWEAYESGYSAHARPTVVECINELLNEFPPGRVGFVHMIDRVLFSHAGITADFVKEYFGFELEDMSIDDITYMVRSVNDMGRNELWQNESPLWTRPQYDPVFTKIPGFLQVVGHTPLDRPQDLGSILSLDTFSTTPAGYPIGDNRFVEIDTVEKTWNYSRKTTLTNTL